ncbi:hypothetical protein [Mycolicibacterium brisbanense]
MKIAVFALAVSAALIAPAAAHADNIDFGTDQASCQAAEHQLIAGGNTSADCFQTGPGHYSLTYDRDRVRSYSPAPAYIPAPIYLPPAPPANANVGPDLGSDCAHAQLNIVTTASDGSSVRCATTSAGGYRWMIDTGRVEPDPAAAGQAAWTACITNPANTAADCRCSVDGNCS